MDDHVDVCDKCGATTTDLDAGFCPSLQKMLCQCGGRWVKVSIPGDMTPPENQGQIV